MDPFTPLPLKPVINCIRNAFRVLQKCTNERPRVGGSPCKLLKGSTLHKLSFKSVLTPGFISVQALCADTRQSCRYSQVRKSDYNLCWCLESSLDWICLFWTSASGLSEQLQSWMTKCSAREQCNTVERALSFLLSAVNNDEYSSIMTSTRSADRQPSNTLNCLRTWTEYWALVSAHTQIILHHSASVSKNIRDIQ